MPSVLGFLSVLTLGVLSALAYRTYFGSAKPEPRVAGRGATKRIDATSMPTPQGMAEEWQRLETLTDELYTREARLRDFSSALRWPSKNRYADILPFEHSRVRLRSPDNYINANFISGTRYIATQAPLPATMGDFWRMVWEQRCTVIVMLTRLTEAGRRKADAYWPPRAGVRQEYGELSVVMEREEMDEAAHTHTRVLTLCEKSMCRTVHQLHYLGWPDFGVPDCADDVVALIEKCGELSTGTTAEDHSCIHTQCARDARRRLKPAYALRRARRFRRGALLRWRWSCWHVHRGGDADCRFHFECNGHSAASATGAARDGAAGVSVRLRLQDRRCLQEEAHSLTMRYMYHSIR